MDIRRTRTCQKCKAVIPLDRVRLMPKDKDNNLLLCDKCAEEFKKSSLEKVKSIPTKTKPLPRANYKGYFCDRCKYNFKVDDSKVGVTTRLFCPFCGKADRLVEK